MSKNLKRILIVSLVGISIFLIWDWQKNKIEFQKERTLDGWYKYSNNFIEFEYPLKLRNCHECGPMKTGSIFTVMTDGEYILMTMSNQNSSYIINPEQIFTNPKNERTREIRTKLDSIVLKNNISPTDTFIMDNLQIKEIQLYPDSSKMRFDMKILDEQLFAEITSDELKNCGFESWNYWKLEREGDNIKKFVFGLMDGRFFLSQGKKEIVFEIQKIKRRNLYTNARHNLNEKELARFFNSIKMKK